MHYLRLSQVGNMVSFNRIAGSMKISAGTVKEYIGYAEDAYLLHLIRKFDYSAQNQQSHAKKVYCADTGLMNAVAYAFSDNIGHIMENLVCTTLIQRGLTIWYHKDRYECDFVVTHNGQPIQVIQVCATLQKDETRKREIRGLVEAIKNITSLKGLL